MLPRRFALVRHVDYSGAAGTGVIAYGVAFDDGQVVLRWSSAHRATSVLDSVEDLIAAHGHGEATSIEWIDAPPGTADSPAQQQGGRRARRPAPPSDEPPATDVPEAPEPAPLDVRPAAPAPQKPAPAEVRPAAQAPRPPAPAEPADTRYAAPAPTPQAPADPRHTTAPVPTMPPAPPAAAQPTAPSSDQPATGSSSVEPAQRPIEPPAQPNVVAGPRLPAPRLQNPTGHQPEPEAPSTPTPAAPSPERPAAISRPDRGGDQRSPDHDADIIDQPPSGRGVEDERRSRHAAIATQPMTADLPEERAPRRAAGPTHESPRSIFEEAEPSARPDLWLASSNGRGRDLDDTDESGDGSPEREEFDGYFSSGHQHLETVTGLLDLPAGLNKRGRGPGTDQDALASRRNGRHRGGE